MTTIHPELAVARLAARRDPQRADHDRRRQRAHDRRRRQELQRHRPRDVGQLRHAAREPGGACAVRHAVRRHQRRRFHRVARRHVRVRVRRPVGADGDHPRPAGRGGGGPLGSPAHRSGHAWRRAAESREGAGGRQCRCRTRGFRIVRGRWRTSRPGRALRPRRDVAHADLRGRRCGDVTAVRIAAAGHGDRRRRARHLVRDPDDRRRYAGQRMAALGEPARLGGEPGGVRVEQPVAAGAARAHTARAVRRRGGARPAPRHRRGDHPRHRHGHRPPRAAAQPARFRMAPSASEDCWDGGSDSSRSGSSSARSRRRSSTSSPTTPTSPS